jgi:lipid-A-disaccharide synthase
MVRVPFISLINLIAGREVVKELIQRKANEKNVTAELMRILKDGDGREGILNSYNDIIKILDTGSASDNTARLMLEDLKRA